jgi:hypothetical protein
MWPNMRDAVVGYRCVADQHRATGRDKDELTVHDGQWAYCPFDSKADGHRWRPTGGVSLAALKRAQMRHGR